MNLNPQWEIVLNQNLTPPNSKAYERIYDRVMDYCDPEGEAPLYPDVLAALTQEEKAHRCRQRLLALVSGLAIISLTTSFFVLLDSLYYPKPQEVSSVVSASEETRPFFSEKYFSFLEPQYPIDATLSDKTIENPELTEELEEIADLLTEEVKQKQTA